MSQNISYTAAYAEMTRWILQGAESLQQRDPATAIRCFARATQLADEAALGPMAFFGSSRNLASAYRLAGLLADAERIFRDLLERPELGEDERPFILHELGMTLALAGSPEASAVLASALDQYTEHEDALLCALDLAEMRLTHGEGGLAYQLLVDVLRPEDRYEHPERYAHAHLLLARSALALGEIARANAHLATAHPVLSEAKIPVFHSLYLAILAEREYLEGRTGAAQAQAIAALEKALTQAEVDTGEVLRTIASIFLKIFRKHSA